MRFRAANIDPSSSEFPPREKFSWAFYRNFYRNHYNGVPSCIVWKLYFHWDSASIGRKGVEDRWFYKPYRVRALTSTPVWNENFFNSASVQDLEYLQIAMVKRVERVGSGDSRSHFAILSARKCEQSYMIYHMMSQVRCNKRVVIIKLKNSIEQIEFQPTLFKSQQRILVLLE